MINRRRQEKRKPNRMLVLSWDAVGSQDLEFLETLPHFKLFLEHAAVCRKVKSVYPSLTYPAHTSIVTGRLPVHHGVINNLQFQPEREKPDWFWQRRWIKGTTLYDEAEAAGIKTAALLWPVTAGAKISYNLPEIWTNRPWQNQLMVSFFNGTPKYEIELFRRYGHLLDGIKQPMLDNFIQSSLLYTLKHYHPGLTLVHLTDVDAIRHQYGVSSSQAQAALRRQDMRLGEIMGFLKRTGERKTTNIVLLGDHYQKDVHCALYPNYEIVKRGWAKKKGEGIVHWRASAQSADGACYIYLRDQTDQELKAEVAKWLREWKQKPDSEIQAVFTGRKAWEKGADPQCTFMLEAKKGFYFSNGCSHPFREASEKNHIHRGAHGYDPDSPDYETFFMASGPDFRPGNPIKEMYLIDEGPILARALGLNLEDADGAVINAFFDRSINLRFPT